MLLLINDEDELQVRLSFNNCWQAAVVLAQPRSSRHSHWYGDVYVVPRRRRPVMDRRHITSKVLYCASWGAALAGMLQC